MLGIVATLKVKPGMEQAFEAVAKELVAKVNANEPGCTLYALHHGEAPCTYVFMERYIDQSAVDAHRTTDYFKSLGRSGDITKAQHCRAEFYLAGHGWVPVDPADVRKVVLEEKPGGIPLDDPQVQKARAKLYGAWEMNWLAYNYAHDVKLPGSTGPQLAFLMYPQAETADVRRDCLDPDTFRYSIASREIQL